jgi:predicted ATPase/DNA-binding winged helix-turn-helix (wHTH) protein
MAVSPGLRRSIRFGNVEVLPAAREVLVGGTRASLGARAFDVLVALIERSDRVVSKHELLDLVWPGIAVEESNLPVHISTLRKLLGPEVICTVPGRGYRFTAALDGEATLTSTSESAAASDAQSPTGVRTNLPAEIPPLYGRDEDLLELRSLIGAHRLVTLTGAGGIGKSVLAQALAHQLGATFKHGAWLVEFAPVIDDSFVPTTVARVLNISLDGDERVTALASALSTRHMLLVLDNCEHLVRTIAPLVEALLRAAPQVRLLVTSQEPLKVKQEHVYRLDGLALPSTTDVDAARQAGATALFDARAQEADPRFVLRGDNVAAVVDICKHLDGIPLAIELAAARVPLLGVEGLRARLGDRFRVLTGGHRMGLRRHQTLRAALQWSHDLLTPDEQAVFRRLGTFVGSFGLTSAQHLAADDTIHEWDVLDHLGTLVERSLVMAESGQEPRYRLLETTRAFALEMLQLADESDRTQRRHAETILRVFEGSLETRHSLPTQVQVARYILDLDNVRAALDWAASPAGDVQLAVALAAASAWMWFYRRLRPEGLRRVRSAIDSIDSATPPYVEARLLVGWASLANPEYQPQHRAALARAIELFRAVADRQELFVALWLQGAALADCGQLDDAEGALHEAEEMLDAGWPEVQRARLLMLRAWLLKRRGRFEESVPVDEELLQLAKALDDHGLVVHVLCSLEQSAAALGRLAESVKRGRELLELTSRNPHLTGGLEHSLVLNLSMSLAQLGELREAIELARSAYRLAEQVGLTSDGLDLFSFLAFKRGRMKEAARLVGHADKRLGMLDYARHAVEQRLRNSVLEGLRGVLTEQELAQHMKAGESLSDEQCAHIALDDDV